MKIRYLATSCGDNFWQVDIMIWQDNINNWQVKIKIWQVDIIIWLVMAEICHHSLTSRRSYHFKYTHGTFKIYSFVPLKGGKAGMVIAQLPTSYTTFFLINKSVQTHSFLAELTYVLVMFRQCMFTMFYTIFINFYIRRMGR